MNKEYKVIEIRIERMKETERLYNLEEQRNQQIKICADEWARLIRQKLKKDYPFFQVALPTAFFDMLGSYDTKAGICACKFFLEKQGYKVEKIKDDKL
jgi:hypothetical protein